MSFSNVAVGVNKHPKAQFNFGHDTITTFDFGECQPYSVRLLPMGGHVRLSTQHLVRLSPLSRPTFGRMFFRQYHQFVPLSDIFPKINQFLANQKSLGRPTTESYTTHIPWMDSNVLMAILTHKNYSTMTLYGRPADTSTHEEKVSNSWNFAGTTGTSLLDTGANSFIPHHTNIYTTANNGWYNLVRWDGTAFTHKGDFFKDPTYADFSVYRHYKDTTVAGTAMNASVRGHWWLNRRGLRLYKIFLACGYKPTFTADFKVSILPLLAFYKAWFDIMCLPQYMNWETTKCAKLIRWIDVENPQGDKGITLTGTTQLDHDFFDLFKQFCDDELSYCYYTRNPDFVSAHTAEMVSGAFADKTLPQRTKSADDFNNLNFDGAFVGSNQGWKRDNDDTDQPKRVIVENASTRFNEYLTHLDVDVLMKMYYWSNTRSAIGNQIAEILKAKGYEQWVHDVSQTNFIGHTSDVIKVSEVISTADTQTRSLADYAGQSSQAGSSRSFSFDAKEAGYVISFGAVVPEARQSMALDPTLLGIGNGDAYNGTDYNVIPFYNPLYDGLGYESTPRACIGHDDFMVDNGAAYVDNTQSFGNVPRFTGWKIAQNIRSGCMALQSQLNTFAPWHMDAMILQGWSSKNYPKTIAANGSFTDSLQSANIAYDKMPCAGPHWRFPARYAGLGNYKRIFLDGMLGLQNARAAGTSIIHDEEDKLLPADDFMVDIVVDCTASLAMLPVSRTYDTMSEEQEQTGDGTTNIKH